MGRSIAARCRLPLPHGRIGDYADENFDGTIQVDACAGYSLLPKPGQKGGRPLVLAFCGAHGRRKLIKDNP